MTEENEESRYNKIRDNCSVASNSRQSLSVAGGSPPIAKFSEQIPLMEKMRRVDFFHNTNVVRHKKKKAVSANERLYKSAFTMRERKDKLILQSEKDEVKAIAASKFTIPEGSKKLLNRYRSEEAVLQDIGERLHSDGLK